MKKFCFMFLFIPCFIFSLIIESNSLMPILEHVDDNTLLIADFDNTLAESEQQLGTAQWCNELADRYSKQNPNLSPLQIFELVQSLWSEVQTMIKVQPVDPLTKDFHSIIAQ